jgi:hypothetical protein
MTRKMTKTETTKAEAPKADAPKAARAPRARAVKAKPTAARNVFSLQHVPGAAVLTELVEGGLVTAPKLKPGCMVQVAYLKDIERPLAGATLHARVDGVPLEPKSLGHVDGAGRFVRTAAAVEVAPGAQKLEYWFELKTADGQTLWDSNWGRNHWLDVDAAAAS